MLKHRLSPSALFGQTKVMSISNVTMMKMIIIVTYGAGKGGPFLKCFVSSRKVGCGRRSLVTAMQALSSHDKKE